MYTVYIIQSIKNHRYYIGQTSNIENKIKRHNLGQVKSTRNYIPWKIVYMENYKTRSEACRRELEIKKYKSGIKFKKFLGLWDN